METIKININTPIPVDDVITPYEMYECGDYLYIVVDGYYSVREGDVIKFVRNVYREDVKALKAVDYVRRVVQEVIYDRPTTKVFKTIIKLNKIPKTKLNIEHVLKDVDNNRIDLRTPPNIFVQDIVYAKQQGVDTTLQYYEYGTGKYIDFVTNLRFTETDNIVNPGNRVYITSGCQTPEQFIINKWNVIDYKDCGTEKTKNPQTEPMYYYIPFKGNELNIWGSYEGNLLDKLIYYKHNSFYFCDDNETTPYYYSGITGHKCHVWRDVSAVTINGERFERDVETNGVDKYNNVVIAKETGYWNVPVGLAQTNDYVHLNQEQVINEVFTEKIKDAVIENAPVIDMEKVKYAPYYKDGDEYKALTSITYNLHFRVRDLVNEGWQYMDSSAIWNNGVTPSNLGENNVSDMLYYLGYSDNDVQNQKMNLKKTFLRLSFYDSKDPLTQKLLYYSTIFFDSGSLFGKYIKAKSQLNKKGLSTTNIVLNSQDTDYRLDCSFVVRDEYFTEKSSEGFNFYYFPDAIENGERTIYMKIEFNHAKYGRTVPMILWPHGNNGLSLAEAKDRLFTPITIKLLDKNENASKEKMFVYTFNENEYITLNDNTISLNLVEPKLDNGNN